MKKLKTAVIGCGTIGVVHADGYARCEDSELVWMVDELPERARQTAEQYGAAKWSTDYRDAINDPEVGAVSVCLPNDLHCQVTVEALEAGKHVLCEKPIAMNMSEANRMREASWKNDRLLAIGVVNRFNDSVLLLTDAIEAGEIGDVYHVSVMFKAHRMIPGLGGWFTTKSRAGGGVMIDWGVHYLDLALYAIGLPAPRAISGVAHSVLGRDPREYAYLNMWAGPPNLDGVCDVEEFVSGLIRTDGPSICFEGSWAQNIEEGATHIDFLGDKGGIRLNYGGKFTLYGHKRGVLYRTEPSYRMGEMYYEEMASFVDCALNGKPSPADIETVLPAQRILDGFYQSAADGREVRIEES